MKCLYPKCKNTNIFCRCLCEKHYWKVRDRKELDNYPRMKRKDGTGCFTQGYKILTKDGKRIFEHRYIMEKILGRKLKKREKIHHIDGNGLNNSPENLVVLSQSDHIVNFHNNNPRVFNWNNFQKINKNNLCQVCGKKTKSSFGLCRKHYDTYWHWKQRH